MKIIFHHPLPIDQKSTSASGIRPLRILEAFRALGYEVTVVAGYGKERVAAVKKIKNELLNGGKYEFCYSESSTQPTLLTEKHHLPLYPVVDFGLFSLLKKNNVPIGLFYRDIYWLFSGYGKGLNPLKVLIAKIFYRYDLLQYRKLLNILYLPSSRMGSYIPWVEQEKMLPLPPGHSVINFAESEASPNGLKNEKNIKLLYIGGMSDHYQMHELFNALPISGVEMTLCTRSTEWASVSVEYKDPEKLNVRIVHQSGDRLKALYEAADVAMLYVKPQEYRDFAAPFKLYEYLGEGKPIIASEGTLAGEFVKENKVGWVVPYQSDHIKELLAYLLANPEEVDAAKRQCLIVAKNHNWLSRARQVAFDLTGVTL